MKRIKILKQGVVTNQAEFNEPRASEWLTQEIANGSFGKPERWTPEKDCTPDELAKSLGTREVDGPIGSDVKVIEHHLPAEFTVVEEDITEELVTKKTKQEALQYLKDTDWYVLRQMDNGIPMPEEVRLKRQQSRELL